MNSPAAKQLNNVRDVNLLKKQLTFGDVSQQFQVLSSCLSELEEANNMGFDLPVDKILNQRYWNKELLGFEYLDSGSIQIDRKPRVSLHRAWDDGAYIIKVIPWANDEEFGPLSNKAEMELVDWDPFRDAVMIKIPKLAEFIRMAFSRGDDADKALVKIAHLLVEKQVNRLLKGLDVAQQDGLSVVDLVLAMKEQPSE